jgi:transcriptional antiterminator NusG
MFGNISPFVPMCEFKFKKKNEFIIEKRRFFPGYVFLESDMEGYELVSRSNIFISRSEYIYKFLMYGHGNLDWIYNMRDEEIQNLKKLWNTDHCVEISKGFIEGDRVVITEGSLEGYESNIKIINRHKMQATLEIEIMGALRELTVGLEIISKT